MTIKCITAFPLVSGDAFFTVILHKDCIFYKNKMKAFSNKNLIILGLDEKNLNL